MCSPKTLPALYSAAATPSSKFAPISDCAMSSPEEEGSRFGEAWNTELPAAPAFEPAASGGLLPIPELADDDMMELAAVLGS